MTGQSLLPFQVGDIFVPATILDPSARYPTGRGRIVQLDSALRAKAEVETGRTGLISALAIGPDGVLWALDPQARGIDRYGRDGQLLPPLPLPDRAFGSILFRADGDILLGEHLAAADGPFAGEGRIFRIAADGTVRDILNSAWNGGVGGFLGVTHMALVGDAVWHVSETGPHIYAHDIAGDQRLGPVYTRTDPPPMLFGLCALPSGDMAVALGNAIRILSPDGTVRRDIALPEGRGWANLVLRPGHDSLWAVDFFGGRLAEVALADGAVLRLADLGFNSALTSVAEVL